MYKSPSRSESLNHQSKSAQTKTRRTPLQKFLLALIIVIIIGLIVGLIVVFVLIQRDPESLGLNRPEYTDPIYSNLTGLEINDAKLNQQPTFCVQISNGSTDGARPQAGLNSAAVVFEAVAEQGITRFAAIFQNPTVSAIGPVRSLRPYYLEWDTPFDCTIVHSGGSDEALTEVSNGQYRNLDIDTDYYSWREYNTMRLWNNLFTSSAELNAYNQQQGYTTSNPKVFPRRTPEDVEIVLEEQQACTDDPACLLSTAHDIRMTFWNISDYTVLYHYDPTTNTYPRSYATGEAHTSYECPADLNQPNTKQDCGEPVQIAPSALVAMIVQENTMSDQYHEHISTVSRGDAYIFQNGTVIKGSWRKSSQSNQIVFLDENDAEITFNPGQLWIAAIPQYGNVFYE